ncbi:MAG: fibronectin type III domain-containing protein [Anaerolineae bacterium]|nr:fibronectin type III domain-containing protein [Anaerolineae bacterium]
MWLCDTQPPRIIEGPDAKVEGDTVTIGWTTDERSTSVVQFGTAKGRFEKPVVGDSGVTVHEVTLKGLERATLYHYQVGSTDASGNETSSRTFFFETGADLQELPEGPSFRAIEDPLVDSYTLQFAYPGAGAGAQALDPSKAIERIDVYVDGVLVGSDYEDSNGVYSVIYSPHAHGVTSGVFYGAKHQVEAKVWSWAQVGQVNPYLFEPQRDSIPVDVAITFPPPDHTVYIAGDSVPAGKEVTIMVEAREFDWRCTWNGGSTPLSGVSPECGDVAQAVEMVQFLVGGQVKHEDTPTSDEDFWFGWNMPLGGYGPHPQTVVVRAFDSEWQKHDVQTTINIVQIEVPEPVLDVSRTVTRYGTRFVVELEVENESQPGIPVKIDRIEDNVTAFQAIHKDTLHYTVRSRYDWHAATSFTAKVDYVDIDLFTNTVEDTITLQPGESLVVNYEMVPVLYEDQPYFQIGHQNVKVWYEDALGNEELVGFDRELDFIQSTSWSAVGAADYVLVTHPVHLIERFDRDPVNDLLSSMARLASLKSGVLGYLEADNPRYFFDALVEPDGAWALDLHPNFRSPGLGYVLIVGETEIVPSWRVQTEGWTVRESDHLYAADGDGPPNLNLGRIVGDDPAKMRAVIDNAIHVHTGWMGHGFDQSSALLVSGTGNMHDIMVNEVNWVENELSDQGLDVIAMHWQDYASLGSFAHRYDKHDQVAAGDVIGVGGVDEIVVANDATNRIEVLNRFGSVLAQFQRTVEDGDALAVGDLNADGTDEIVYADASADSITAYTANGAVLAQFGTPLAAYDTIVVGNVVGGAEDEIVVALQSGPLYVLDMAGALLNDIGFGFAKDNRLAAGDVDGNGQDEIVLLRETARAGAKITGTVYSLVVVGDKLAVIDSFELGDYRPRDPLAVGDVTGDGIAEIVMARAHGATSIYDLAGNWVRWPVPGTTTPGDWLAVGQFSTTGEERIVHADQDDRDDTFILLDIRAVDQQHEAYRAVAPGRDILFFLGHGSPDTWGPALRNEELPAWFTSDPHFPLPLGSTNPVVLGSSCLTGNYEDGDDYGIPEAFLDSGAGVYIGATENSSSGPTEASLRWFFDRWGYGEEVGKAWADMERAKWGNTEYGTGWDRLVHEYNVYGDPKYKAVTLTGQVGAAAAPLAEVPPPSIKVEVPMYEVTSLGEDIDQVTIPDGETYVQVGKAQVPFWVHTIEITAGYQIQGVVLVGRTDAAIVAGLQLPVTTDDIWSARAGPWQAAARQLGAEPEESWTPDLDQAFTWNVVAHADGTSTLSIVLYPLFYNEQTGVARWHDRYQFDIVSTQSDVSVELLTTDQPAYSPGDLVSIDLWVGNEGAAMDVLVEAAIVDSVSGELVDGLPLRALHEMSGRASFALVWDSAGVDAGEYAVEVTLHDEKGNVLDREADGFRLGVVLGKVLALTATPSAFSVGDVIDVDMVFRNAGDLPLEGVATIEVRRADGLTVTHVYTQAIAPLAPGSEVLVSDSWDTGSAVEGAYRVVGFVRYDSTATPPELIEVRTWRRVYLPTVLRNAP